MIRFLHTLLVSTFVSFEFILFGMNWRRIWGTGWVQLEGRSVGMGSFFCWHYSHLIWFSLLPSQSQWCPSRLGPPPCMSPLLYHGLNPSGTVWIYCNDIVLYFSLLLNLQTFDTSWSYFLVLPLVHNLIHILVIDHSLLRFCIVFFLSTLPLALV